MDLQQNWMSTRTRICCAGAKTAKLFCTDAARCFLLRISTTSLTRRPMTTRSQRALMARRPCVMCNIKINCSLRQWCEYGLEEIWLYFKFMFAVGSIFTLMVNIYPQIYRMPLKVVAAFGIPPPWNEGLKCLMFTSSGSWRSRPPQSLVSCMAELLRNRFFSLCLC